MVSMATSLLSFKEFEQGGEFVKTPLLPGFSLNVREILS